MCLYLLLGFMWLSKNTKFESVSSSFNKENVIIIYPIDQSQQGRSSVQWR
jgi:hypothetical protein